MSLLSRLFGASPSQLRGEQEFLLDLSKCSRPMKRVYLLSEELRQHPQRVEKTRALTLDKSRPNMGLKGRWGLFASPEWWHSINTGKMPLEFVSGTIVEAYEAGQDRSGANNTIVVRQSDRSESSVGIYVNAMHETQLFQPGGWVELVYALDELKSKQSSRVALEMAVSINEPEPSETVA